jgi:hypothetical protein
VGGQYDRYGGSALPEYPIMLWTDRIFKKKVKTNKEINDIIDTIENSKKTMGNLLNEIKTNYGLTDKQISDLDNILKKRNYLIHKYFKIEIQKLLSEIGKKEMLKFLCDFIDKVRLIDTELKVYYRNYTLKLGLTDERIEGLMNEMKTTELERDK